MSNPYEQLSVFSKIDYLLSVLDSEVSKTTRTGSKSTKIVKLNEMIRKLVFDINNYNELFSHISYGIDRLKDLICAASLMKKNILI